MRFNQVIGHTDIKMQLTKAIDAGKIGHSILLLGKEGNGSLPIALALASYANCLSPIDQDSCGSCSSCIKMDRLMHPDLHLTFPFVRDDKMKEKTESTLYLAKWREQVHARPYLSGNEWMSVIAKDNQQGNISTYECQQIIKRLNLSKFEGKRKVLILWMAEYLGNAGNILLKTIEEPTKDTLIIIVAEQEKKILQTILSRCQVYRLSPLKQKDVAAQLQLDYQISEEEANRMAFIAEGNYNYAGHLMKQDLNQNIDTISLWFRYLVKNDFEHLNQWVNEFSMLSKMKQKTMMRYLVNLIRTAKVGQYLPEQMNVLQENEKKLGQFIVSKLSHTNYESVIDLLQRTAYYLERNLNTKLLLFNVSVYLNQQLRS